MQKQLYCQGILLIHVLCFIYFQKEHKVAVIVNIHIQANLHGMIEETSPTNAILSRIICHQ